jgi:hypothetical protein
MQIAELKKRLDEANEKVPQRETSETILHSGERVKDIQKDGTKTYANVVKDTLIKPSFKKLIAKPVTLEGLVQKSKDNVKTIYFKGVERMRISELKKILFESRFVLSKIFNLDFIGRNVLEVVVHATYCEEMKKRFLGQGLATFEFDPRKPDDPEASEERKKECIERFKARMNRVIERGKCEVSVSWAKRQLADTNHPEDRCNNSVSDENPPKRLKRSSSSSGSESDAGDQEAAQKTPQPLDIDAEMGYLVSSDSSDAGQDKVSSPNPTRTAGVVRESA